MVNTTFKIFSTNSKIPLNVELAIDGAIYYVVLDGEYIGKMSYDNNHGTGFLTDDERLKPYLFEIEKHLIDE